MSLLFLDAMIATERLYDSSVGVISDCLTNLNTEEAVVSDTDSVEDHSAMLRLLIGETDNAIPIYAYDSDQEEEDATSQEIITRIRERILEHKAKEAAEAAEKNEDGTEIDPAETTENDRGQTSKFEGFSKLEQLCSHDQYGLDVCMFLLSPDSPLHCPNHFNQDVDEEEVVPDQYNQVTNGDEVVPENEADDNDEAWFAGIDCAKVLCGQYAIEADDKTAETVANSESSNDGSATVDGTQGDSTIESSVQERSLQVESHEVSPNALTAHLKNLIAKNKRASGDVPCGGLDCNNQSILSGEIRFRTEEQPEPVGRNMTQPSDDDYLMLIQTDPKGTSFCTDDSSVQSEVEDLCPAETRSVREAPAARFNPRSASKPMPLEPDGADLAPAADEASVQSETKIVHVIKTDGYEMIHLDIVAADLRHENVSVSSSKWSQRALLDDDHQSILNGYDPLEHYREPDGSTVADIVLSSTVSEDKPRKKLLSADDTIEDKPIVSADDTVEDKPSKNLLSADDTIEDKPSKNLLSADDIAEEEKPLKLLDIALSSAVAGDEPVKNLLTADDIIEAMSDDDTARGPEKFDDDHTEVFSEPFDETEDNFRSSPHQQIRNEIVAVDGAHCSFELPNRRAPTTNLQKRLNLLERLRGLSDGDSDMLCACVQGCGDFADSTFFECSVDEASLEEGENEEQLSLD